MSFDDPLKTLPRYVSPQALKQFACTVHPRGLHPQCEQLQLQSRERTFAPG